MSTYNPRFVPQARPCQITDRMLNQLRLVAHNARQGMASQAECEWLLSAAGPLLDELAARRTVMGDAQMPSDDDTVVYLPVVN